MSRFVIFACLLVVVCGYHLAEESPTETDTDTGKDLSACQCKSGYGCSCQGNDGTFKVTVVFTESHDKAGKDTVVWGYFKIGKVSFLKRFTVRTLDGFCRTIKGIEVCFTIYHIEVYGKVHGCIDLTKPKKITLGCFSLPIV